MGTTLTGTKPKDTYDSLIKVGDNGPISGTAKYLSDGLGNDLPIAVSTTNVGIGESSPDANLHVSKVGNGNSVIVSNDQTGSQVNIGVGVVTAGLPFLGTNTNSNPLQVGTRADSDMIFVRNSTERARVTANGLTFNGDTAAANALDDYEEGTWTMGVSFGGAAVGVTYAFNTGRYTKIGRKVTAVGFLGLSNKGTSTGSANITGLPFTISAGTSFYSASAFAQMALITYTGQMSGYGVVGNTTILLQITNAGSLTSLTDTNFQNGSEIMVSFTYFV
jgi:hypothetical protein